MTREIRKLRDLGNGSSGITLPKNFLRELDLIDDNDELADAHIMIEQEGNQMFLFPLH